MAIWSPEVNVENVVLVDGSATTQPISGSVSVSNFPATQPVSGAVSISGSVAVSNLPATQPVSGAVSVSNFPATQPVSGTVAVSNFPGTSSSATITRVATSASSTLLLAANANRKGFIITTETGTANYVALGATASLTSYTYLLGSATTLDKTGYTGPISLIRSSGSGSVQVTELV